MRDHPSRSIALPEELESSRGKLIYLYLQVRGATTIDELKAELDLQLLTLYGLLGRLQEDGFVRKNGDRWLVADASPTPAGADGGA
jgi:Mn-dependent DtxR family transcriptional regulator